ncbi:hypothetical protein Tdes44962_MAKER05513 [Teratosphaeria destructans]|uniref:Uncharacterized protein n=1 Tax=Teratosphaeria destructans TaxID=418781 RepID=A0A9W7SJZ2_9PEZI|nr:hypothetical protein Tdes44962_MAKER05513 [Teratosphaeria destructans]
MEIADRSVPPERHQWPFEVICPTKDDDHLNAGARTDFEASFDERSLQFEESIEWKPIDGPTHHDILTPCLGNTSAGFVRKRSFNLVGEYAHDIIDAHSSSVVRQMVVLAVRAAITISGVSESLPKGFRLRNIEGFASLSDIAPAIWSPGYITAVSSRAVFLPTLAHALVNVADKSRSVDLRSAVSRLQSMGSRAWQPNDPAHGGLTVRLWHMLRDALYDQSAARRLELVPNLRPVGCRSVLDTAAFFTTDGDDWERTTDIGPGYMLDEDSGDDAMQELEFDEESNEGDLSERLIDDQEDIYAEDWHASLSNPLDGIFEILNSTFYDSIDFPATSESYSSCAKGDELLSVSEIADSPSVEEISGAHMVMPENHAYLHANRSSVDGHFGSDLFAEGDMGVTEIW